MAYCGAYLTIVITVLLHFTITGTYLWFLNLCDIEIRFFVFTTQGLVYISYPLIGLLADVKLTRYRMICFSCWVTFVSHLLLFIIVLYFGLPYSIHHDDGHFALGIVLLIPTTVSLIVGKRMFESTVIQFGTDQMNEASSSQLSAFIHWYCHTKMCPPYNWTHRTTFGSHKWSQGPVLAAKSDPRDTLWLPKVVSPYQNMSQGGLTKTSPRRPPKLVPGDPVIIGDKFLSYR